MGIREDLLERIIQSQLNRGQRPIPPEISLPARRTLPPISWAGEETRPTTAFQPKYSIATAERPTISMQPTAPSQVAMRAPVVPTQPIIGAVPRLPTIPVTPKEPSFLGKVGQAVGRGFEWVQRELEQPWAEAITTPLRAGESYETWKAKHKLVAGIAEFTMPLWWLPYFGWAAKGAGLIPKIGGSIAKGVKATEAAMALPITLPLKGVSKIIKLPSYQKLKMEIFKEDYFRKLGERLAKIPVLGLGMKAVNPTVAVQGNLAKEGKVIYGGLQELADNSVNLYMANLTRIHRDPVKLFELNELGRMAKVINPTTKKTANWWDVASEPAKYTTQLNAQQKEYLTVFGEMIDSAVKYAEEAGIKITKRDFAEGMRYIPRIWEKQVGLLDTKTGIWRPVGSSMEPEKWLTNEVHKFIPLSEAESLKVETLKLWGAGTTGGAKIGLRPKFVTRQTATGETVLELEGKSGAIPFFQKPRTYDFAEEALEQGLQPGRFVSPNLVMETYLKGIYRMIADKEVAQFLKPLGRTIRELTDVSLRTNTANAYLEYRALRRLPEYIRRASRGEKLPPASIAAIKRVMPELADELVRVKPKVPSVPAKPIPVSPKVKTTKWADIPLATREELGQMHTIPQTLGGKPFEISVTEKKVSGSITEAVWNKFTPLEISEALRVRGIAPSAVRDFPIMPKVVTPAPGVTISGAPFGSVRARQLVGELTPKIKQAEAKFIQARTQRNIAYEVARGSPGWKAVGQPFAAGRLFPEPIAKELNQMLHDRAMPILTAASNVNALSRFMVTGFDFGAGLIQGVPLLMTNPLKWGKAMGVSLHAFVDPTVRARYMLKPENLKVLEKLISEGLIIGDSEFMQAAQAGLLTTKAAQTIDRLNIVQRFSTSFNTFGDMARIEWAKGLLPMVERTGGSLKELSAFLNEATGVMSSRALGVGASQRALEGAVLLFAPRYFRANVSFWADMTRGGLRGQLARDALTSMIMGTFFWYYGVTKALGQEPELNPSSGKFLTVQVGQDHIGLGSMQVAMFRLLGNIYKTATEDPQGFIKFDSRDNPLIRFMRSRVAPITGASWDIATGKTFIGEPLDTPVDIARHAVGSRMVPFWLDGMLFDYPKAGLPKGAGEFAGLRAWPLQLWERRDELREKLARQEFGAPWYSKNGEMRITTLQRKQIEEQYPELLKLTEEAYQQRLERGGVEEETWNAYSEARKSARASFESHTQALQDQYDAGQMDGYQFKEGVQRIASEMRGAYRNIEKNPEFAEIIAYFDQPLTYEQMKETPLEDIAFDKYMSFLYSPEMYDATGEYLYDMADKLESIFVAEYGIEMMDYVKQRLSQGKNIPPLLQEYYKATEVLKPYWEVKSDADRYFLTDSSAKRAFIGRRRTALKRLNPQVAYYVRLFYTQNQGG